jgi:hypothetical protein
LIFGNVGRGGVGDILGVFDDTTDALVLIAASAIALE